MDLQTKQMVDRNQVGLIASEIIVGSMFMLSVLSFAVAVTPEVIIRTILCVVIFVSNIIVHRAWRKTDKYMHFCGCSMVVLYLFTLITTSQPSMYVIFFPIAILVMGFQNIRLISAGVVIAIVGLFISDAIWLSKGYIIPNEIIIEVFYVLGSCVLATYIVRIQTRHLKENIDAVQSGADVQMQVSNDIVKLAEELNQKFVEAKEVSDTLNETMQTSHESVGEIAASTRMTAQAIEQQTSQTSDIQLSIQSVGEEAKAMGEISERTSDSVEQGVELIGKLKVQASEVAKINMETRKTTEALNESIKDVQAITETILGISSQTNLLALNASIEAARAGEAGKGFAVVADEIRTLSEGTRQATEKISEIIERLTNDAQTAAESMLQSADYAQKQNDLIEETGTKLQDIQAETDELHNGVVQINASVQHVISANTLIMDSITNLSATSEEVAASTDTVISVSDSSMDALDNMNRLLGEISQISENMEKVAND